MGQLLDNKTDIVLKIFKFQMALQSPKWIYTKQKMNAKYPKK